VIDQNKFEHLLPLAIQWAKSQELLILEHGTALGGRQIEDAACVGVRNAGRVRLLLVDRIPFPENHELAEAARRAQIITDASRAVTIGHGILIRADSWQDRGLLVHSLVHVAQFERSGGDMESFVEVYLNDRNTCASFTVGALEEEARGMARAICASEEAALQTHVA
jgi:hypothetical protein